MFKWSGEDFTVYKEVLKYSEDYSQTSYFLAVEGSIGFKRVSDFIKLYEEFTKQFLEYLTDNKYEHPNKSMVWKKVYSAREFEVLNNGNCFYVFLDASKKSNIWELYEYLNDVIQELEIVHMNAE